MLEVDADIAKLEVAAFSSHAERDARFFSKSCVQHLQRQLCRILGFVKATLARTRKCPLAFMRPSSEAYASLLQQLGACAGTVEFGARKG